MTTPQLTCYDCGHTSHQENYRWFPNDEVAICKDEEACVARLEAKKAS